MYLLFFLSFVIINWFKTALLMNNKITKNTGGLFGVAGNLEIRNTEITGNTGFDLSFYNDEILVVNSIQKRKEIETKRKNYNRLLTEINAT